MEVTEVSKVESPIAPEIAPNVEVKPEVVVPEKKESLSSQFAALAKKEKRILSEKQAVDARVKELEEKLKLYEQFESKKKEAKTNPLDYLSEAGLSYDELTQFMLNGGKPKEKDKTSELEQKLNAFMEQAERDKKSQAELQEKQLQEQEEKVIQQFKDNVKKHIEAKKDTYELVNLYDAQDLVISTIEAHYEKTQEILDLDDAASKVEEYLEGEAKKIANTNKFKDKFKLDDVKKDSVEKKDSVTLNSNLNASSVPSSLPAHTENERIKRALAALG